MPYYETIYDIGREVNIEFQKFTLLKLCSYLVQCENLKSVLYLKLYIILNFYNVANITEQDTVQYEEEPKSFCE